MVRSHRLVDVLDLLLPHEFVLERELAPDGVPHCLGDADAARLCQTLKPGSDVDALPVDVVPVDYDFTEVYADSEANLALLW